MLSQFKYLLLVAFPILLLTSCKDKEPIVDVVPFIQVDSLSGTTLRQFQDELVIHLRYEDGDGDIGFDNPDSMAIFVWDSRVSDPETFHIQPLAPPGESLIIRGTIDIRLHSIFLLGNGAPETVNYTIKIRDRADNWSNEVITEDVIITQ